MGFQRGGHGWVTFTFKLKHNFIEVWFIHNKMYLLWSSSLMNFVKGMYLCNHHIVEKKCMSITSKSFLCTFLVKFPTPVFESVYLYSRILGRLNHTLWLACIWLPLFSMFLRFIRIVVFISYSHFFYF